ncbi:MAG: bifunctional protein-serine/threonine kinase/phosphatase [Pseudomonadota bacterium]
MSGELKISIGQHSDKGRKDTNQDFHGALIPQEPQLGSKGIAVVLADGISSSSVSRIAAESAVKSFLTDYYCTPDSWSVKTAAQRVIAATNSWLHSQTLRSQNPYDKDKGYVCTLSVIVLKSTTAHIFHIGDSRLCRISGNSLEKLTNEHRIFVSDDQHYLSRALGINNHIEIDYQAIEIEKGDVFFHATDGAYEHVGDGFIVESVRKYASDLDKAAALIVEKAFQQGSPDNMTVQIVRVDALPTGEASEMFEQISELPLPPTLEARMVFDGYRIVRELHASNRSHIYLAVDIETNEMVALKVPSIDLRDDLAYLARFRMEEWVARRINNAHVLKPCIHTRKRNFLYVATEFIDGQTLMQWMIDNPKPSLEIVRGIVEQIAKGLRAFHRMEMLHQDLRPENIMIDRTGTVKIIDFGSTRVAGIVDASPIKRDNSILGSIQYTAPEYFVGEPSSSRSDIFSLGVITYQILTGKLPYGAKMARARTKSQLRKLQYISAFDDHSEIPVWMDGVLKRAVHVDPYKRYDALSEFTFDLRYPNEKYLPSAFTPLIERNPLLFWRGLCLILAIVIFALLITLRVHFP